ncbi:MAG TPA: aminopeptidase [Lachnospiraceae bacterium]|nr:aminopeptidase [Lachnospiraceae bacterium]
MERENRWKTYTAQQLESLSSLCEDYKDTLSRCKTEREFAAEAVARAERAGFRDLRKIVEDGETLKAGDKVYAVWMKKTVVLYVIGRKPLEEGMRILGAHIDSPRLDLKQHPLYEDTELAFLDTHYYGGIKKYQWTTIPLAIHGVVAKKDGSVVKVNVGEDASDPVFCVSDLLIHLSKDQMSKNLADAIEGENLDVLVGSRPLAEDKKRGDTDGGKKETKDLVKQQILNILKDKYGMEEEDFLSAELEIVPAGPARDLGLDRSMVAAYGQDDRVCAFTSLDAILRSENPEYTSCCLLTDKEEIGSVGATGAHSHFFENATAELMDRCGQYSELKLRRCLSACRMLSSDVSAAYDPLYGSAYEKKNSAYFGKGIVYNKYTGARGKSGSNDANAEYFGWVRKVMDDADVAFQTAELGKVDVGGGGTIAYISAAYAMNVVDAGVAVLNMHAPMEVTSKADIFEARNAYMAFLKA